MRFRTLTALTVCIAFLGASIAPALAVPCCCAPKKVQTSCCPVPAPQVETSVPSCCEAQTQSDNSEGLALNDYIDSCGLLSDQTIVRCQCSSHTKTTILTDIRSLSTNIDHSLVSGPAICQHTLVGVDLGIRFANSASSPPVHPLLKSLALRI